MASAAAQAATDLAAEAQLEAGDPRRRAVRPCTGLRRAHSGKNFISHLGELRNCLGPNVIGRLYDHRL